MLTILNNTILHSKLGTKYVNMFVANYRLHLLFIMPNCKASILNKTFNIFYSVVD